jgi:hypothetical protein
VVFSAGLQTECHLQPLLPSCSCPTCSGERYKALREHVLLVVRQSALKQVFLNSEKTKTYSLIVQSSHSTRLGFSRKQLRTKCLALFEGRVPRPPSTSTTSPGGQVWVNLKAHQMHFSVESKGEEGKIKWSHLPTPANRRCPDRALSTYGN